MEISGRISHSRRGSSSVWHVESSVGQYQNLHLWLRCRSRFAFSVFWEIDTLNSRFPRLRPGLWFLQPQGDYVPDYSVHIGFVPAMEGISALCGMCELRLGFEIDLRIAHGLRVPAPQSRLQTRTPQHRAPPCLPRQNFAAIRQCIRAVRTPW